MNFDINFLINVINNIGICIFVKMQFLNFMIYLKIVLIGLPIVNHLVYVQFARLYQELLEVTAICSRQEIGMLFVEFGEITKLVRE